MRPRRRAASSFGGGQGADGTELFHIGAASTNMTSGPIKRWSGPGTARILPIEGELPDVSPGRDRGIGASS